MLPPPTPPFVCLILPVQNKCVPYWPNVNESKEVGPYVVTLKSEQEATDYKMRILEMFPAQQVTSGGISFARLSRSPSPTTPAGFIQLLRPSRSQPRNHRTIWHYQYSSWPDHGVPEEPGGVLSFLDLVNDTQDKFQDAGPMIIHCRWDRSLAPA